MGEMESEVVAVGSEVRRRLSQRLAAEDASVGETRAMRAISTAYAGAILDEENSQRFQQTLIVSFLYFKKPLDLQQTRSIMRERLCEIPRFRSTAVRTEVPGKMRAFSFRQLTDAVLDKCMSDLVTDKSGIIKTQEDINRFTTETYTTKMDAWLPLWRGYVCNNMADGRSMYMFVIDHSIADGVALIETLMSILDDQQDVRDSVPVRRPGKSEPVSCFIYLKGLVSACWGPFVADQLPGDPKNKLKTTDARNPGKTKAVCRTPDISITRIKEVKSKIPGASINDVLMTLASMTIQEYFKKYEPDSLKQKVRGNFPINMRKVTGADIVTEEEFGNRISQGQLRFPLHLEDPMAMFADIKAQLDVIKVSPEPLVRDKFAQWLVLKSSLKNSQLADILLDAIGKCTAMLSNVPGPLTTVKFMGQEVDDMNFYGLAPIGLYFGIVQYNGKFKGGVCCDASLEPEPQKLTECWAPAFERLHAAAMKL